MTNNMTGVNQRYLREENLLQGIELLFFAYRDFIAEADGLLAPLGLGRAHHRVLYFVGRHPAIPVSDLLAILKITKQSLSRVLGELKSAGYLTDRKGQRDRRQRLLLLTDKGRQLERELTATQRRRFREAYRRAGAEAVEGFRLVMEGLLDAESRAILHEPRGRGGAAASDGRPAATAATGGRRR